MQFLEPISNYFSSNDRSSRRVLFLEFSNYYVSAFTFQADDFVVFGDGVDVASDYVSRISVQGVRLVVVASKNVVQCIAAEASQHHLLAISSVVLLIDVVPGHDSSRLRSTRSNRGRI